MVSVRTNVIGEAITNSVNRTGVIGLFDDDDDDDEEEDEDDEEDEDEEDEDEDVLVSVDSSDTHLITLETMSLNKCKSASLKICTRNNDSLVNGELPTLARATLLINVISGFSTRV